MQKCVSLLEHESFYFAQIHTFVFKSYYFKGPKSESIAQITSVLRNIHVYGSKEKYKSFFPFRKEENEQNLTGLFRKRVSENRNVGRTILTKVM